VAYFWTDPQVNLQEIRRVMKPYGHLVLYVVAKEDLGKLKMTQTGLYHVYHVYNGNGKELAGLLTQAGFRQARFLHKPERHRTGVCALAEK